MGSSLELNLRRSTDRLNTMLLRKTISVKEGIGRCKEKLEKNQICRRNNPQPQLQAKENRKKKENLQNQKQLEASLKVCELK